MLVHSLERELGINLLSSSRVGEGQARCSLLRMIRSFIRYNVEPMSDDERKGCEPIRAPVSDKRREATRAIVEAAADLVPGGGALAAGRQSPCCPGPYKATLDALSEPALL